LKGAVGEKAFVRTHSPPALPTVSYLLASNTYHGLNRSRLVQGCGLPKENRIFFGNQNGAGTAPFKAENFLGRMVSLWARVDCWAKPVSAGVSYPGTGQFL
jgi:hypothetical protein